MPNSGHAPPPDEPPPTPPPTAKIIFEKYELGRLLGHGSTAKVFLARHLPSNHPVAIKVFSTTTSTTTATTTKKDSNNISILRETSALSHLHHPNILRLYEVLATRTKAYLVLELAKGGELFTHLASQGYFTEDLARKLFQQLIAAIAFAHSHGVFHRDIKPENLLIDDQGNLKVSDFGLSSTVVASDGILHTCCGSPAYVAPEVLTMKGYKGGAVDIWSAGVVLFVLVSGYLPFNDRNLMGIYRKICRGKFRCPRWTSPEVRRLLGRLFDTDPETRITVEEILRDPWFAKGLDREKWADNMRSSWGEKAMVPPWESSPIGLGSGEFGSELNAFDLISYSSGLDLSGLLGSKLDREHFVLTKPMDRVLDQICEFGREKGLIIRSRLKKVSEIVLERQNGVFVAHIVVYRFLGNIMVGEMEMETKKNDKSETSIRESIRKIFCSSS